MKKKYAGLFLAMLLSVFFIFPVNAVNSDLITTTDDADSLVTLYEYDVTTQKTSYHTISVDENYQSPFAVDLSENNLAETQLVAKPTIKNIQSDLSPFNTITSLIEPLNSYHQRVTNLNAIPACRVGSLTCYWGIVNNKETYSYGTAFLIAPDVIITAAHVVYGTNGTSFPISADFFSKRNGSIYTGTTYEVNYFSVPTNYQYYGGIKNDWAVLHINSNPGSSLGYFSYAISSSVPVDMPVSLLGYVGTYDRYLYLSTEKITARSSTVITTDCYGVEGKSGGPIYTMARVVVTLCSQGNTSYVKGPVITSSISAVFDAEVRASLARWN